MDRIVVEENTSVIESKAANIPAPPSATFDQDGTRDTPVVASHESQRAPRSWVFWVGVALASLMLVVLIIAMGEEGGRLLQVGVQFLPLAILGALAYSGARNSTAAVFAYLWLGVVVLAVLFNAVASVVLAVANVDVLLRAASGEIPIAGLTPSDILKPGAGTALLWTSLLMTLALATSLAMLSRRVRVALSRVIPVDPQSFVHKIALVILTFVLLSSFVPLIAIGSPPILELLKGSDAATLERAGVTVGPLDLVYQFIWMIPATLVVAGWPVARAFRATLVRLGMVRPTMQQVLAAIGLGLALAAFASFILDPGVTWLWQTLGWRTTDVGAFNNLMSNLLTPTGAILIAITAGIGEEMAVRGLLQPRIGLIASNLVFTAFHAFQYGFDALLSVFIIGLALGIIRARSNTTTSAIVHGVYDFALVMASVAIAGVGSGRLFCR